MRIGARVADVRPDPAVVEVQVGDSLAVGEDVKIVAYDANGEPVSGVRILTSLDSRLAVIEEGFLRGVAEGEAELRMAIRAPPASGTGPPEVRTFSAPVRVVGRPVATVEIDDPGRALLRGVGGGPQRPRIHRRRQRAPKLGGNGVDQ